MNPTILAITGLANAGKDTVAAILTHHRHAQHMAFADGVYQEVAKAYHCCAGELMLRDTKETPQAWLALSRCADPHFVQAMQLHYAAGLRDGGIVHERLDLRAPRSPRTILQWWGTEYRRKQQADYWVAATAQRIAASSAPAIVISDLRMPNEAALVRQLGGHIWRITRPGREVATNHASSTSGQEFAPDLVLHNTHNIEHLQGMVLSHWDELQAAHRKEFTPCKPSSSPTPQG